MVVPSLANIYPTGNTGDMNQPVFRVVTICHTGRKCRPSPGSNCQNERPLRKHVVTLWQSFENSGYFYVPLRDGRV